ncbi:hypothetical protein QFW77_11770 [Luteimonas sp. RD2P54]|uniref:Uncharacterized protein n=1 Tax=Luteimonas endophytica TaxID=3042023 RepID=A0ABT6JA16_9GAMM|nr:hypothetical protein [Luteimonas endophytica]MDH5823664.1 hypothetical protein [Luteimonas endophytica]
MPYAFRGEDGASGGKPGRTPAEVAAMGGFRPWQAASLEEARANLRRLVASGTLAAEAEAWCLSKNRENGWFFSTGLDAATAYDNYDYFYRFAIDGLAERPWSAVGPGNTGAMKLYLDADDLDAATMIAVIWPVRRRELLVMSPVPTAAIEIMHDDGWTPLDEG